MVVLFRYALVTAEPAVAASWAWVWAVLQASQPAKPRPGNVQAIFHHRERFVLMTTPLPRKNVGAAFPKAEAGAPKSWFLDKPPESSRVTEIATCKNGVKPRCIGSISQV